MTSLLEELRDTVMERNRLNEENEHLSEKMRIAESLLKEKVCLYIHIINTNNNNDNTYV